MIKITVILLLLTPVFCGKLHCNRESAVNIFKRPTYDFSVRLLDRVAQESGYHFVFSPLSTWLQLTTLAEGARGLTEKEIREVTRYHRMLCFRRKYKEVINSMDKELSFMTHRTNFLIVDKLLNVKESFKKEISKSNLTKILTLNFNDPENAADKANNIIEMNMDGVIDENLEAEDFNLAVLLLTERAYFKGEWKTYFNPVYTSTETFYGENKMAIGKVRMMSQTGYYNITTVRYINAKVLEIPFNTNDRISMLVFLPIDGSVRNLVYYLKDIRLMTVFSLFKLEGTKLATVKIPRFNITTDIPNIPELIYDMGIKRIFHPDLADFGGITDYKIFPSLIQQIANIDVTETGATASAEFLIEGKTEVFNVDRPFLYLIVDRKTDIILFGGIYSNPDIY